MKVGEKKIWGCDIVEIYSIIVNDFVMVKVCYNNEIKKVNINNIKSI
mgnify:FL=1|tara:strand:+ start:546 stop:686 length:141 start_codon:yes stop_codon:yes gene_type:complete